MNEAPSLLVSFDLAAALPRIMRELLQLRKHFGSCLPALACCDAHFMEYVKPCVVRLASSIDEAQPPDCPRGAPERGQPAPVNISTEDLFACVAHFSHAFAAPLAFQLLYGGDKSLVDRFLTMVGSLITSTLLEGMSDDEVSNVQAHLNLVSRANVGDFDRFLADCSPAMREKLSRTEIKDIPVPGYKEAQP